MSQLSTTGPSCRHTMKYKSSLVLPTSISNLSTGIQILCGLSVSLLVGGKQGKFTDPFLFLDEVHSTFIKLKEKFSSTLMLRHFNSEKAVHLETNPSVFAIAGILSQQSTRKPGVDWHQSTSTIERDMTTH